MLSTQNRSLGNSGNEMMDNPKPSNPCSFGQDLDLDLNLNLNLGIVNQFGQLMGEYSWLDEDLWLPKSGDDDDDEQQLELCNDGIKSDFYQSQKNIVLIDQPSEYPDNSIFNGGMESVKEKPSSLKDSSQKQTQTSSPVSVLQRKRSYTSIRSATCSQQATEPDSSGGRQFLATAVSTIEQNQVVQSDSDYSMESSLSDESEEYVPSKQVRTRKISDLLESNHSNKKVKKCMHCEATETPQWRPGPMGRKTLCNACGVQFKHGRLFADYRPLRSPTFNPSLHFNLPKKVQEIRMGYTSERVLNSTPKRHKPKKVKVTGANNTYNRDPNYTLKSKRVEKMRMGSTWERDPKDLTPKFKTVEMRENNNIDLGQTITPESKRVEEMVLDNKNDLSLKPMSEANIVKEMSSINNGEMEQNRAHRAKNFQGLREKAGNLLESDSDRIIKRNLEPKAMKKCSHCESTRTPQWREGPNGRHTLCNACGVQYRHGKLFPEYRPLKSPTYDPLLHSHLPKKVMEMRKRNAEKCAPSDNHEEPL